MLEVLVLLAIIAFAVYACLPENFKPDRRESDNTHSRWNMSAYPETKPTRDVWLRGIKEAIREIHIVIDKIKDGTYLDTRETQIKNSDIDCCLDKVKGGIVVVNREGGKFKNFCPGQTGARGIRGPFAKSVLPKDLSPSDKFIVAEARGALVSIDYIIDELIKEDHADIDPASLDLRRQALEAFGMMLNRWSCPN